jgi:hypothetical protein
MTRKPDIEKQVALIIKDAWGKGLSEAQALDRAGMLLTPSIKVSIGVTALRDIAALLDDLPAQQIVTPGVAMSASDIMRGVAEWIRAIADDNEEANQGI